MSHLVYPGGWVRTSLLSRRFEIPDPRCELCRRMSCGPLWFNIETQAVRCYRCQSADELWAQRERELEAKR